MRDYKSYTLLSAKAADGIDKVIDVRDFQHVIISIATAGTATLTVKIGGSVGDGTTADAPPDFTAAVTATNMWDYLGLINLQSGAAVTGDTGLAAAGADVFEQYEINVNGIKWVCPIVSGRSAGTVTVKAICFNNK